MDPIGRTEGDLMEMVVALHVEEGTEFKKKNSQKGRTLPIIAISGDTKNNIILRAC